MELLLTPTLGFVASNSILRECISEKLGNVHPRASYAGMSFANFAAAAKGVWESVDSHFADCTSNPSSQVGLLVERSTTEMMRRAGMNTSLGTILLFAPLLTAYYHRFGRVVNQPYPDLQTGVVAILENLSPEDAKGVYRSIRICNPGGLGSSSEYDVHSEPPLQLIDAMRHASRYDDIALQYASGFELAFRFADRYHQLEEMKADSEVAGMNVDSPPTLPPLLRLQLEMLAERPDSLIARKGGLGFASEVQGRAVKLLEVWEKDLERGAIEWHAMDRWLRSHRTPKGKMLANPGTHADLIAAAILIRTLRH